jgi:glycosyltransferase involved in cell wall biosynthesis
MNVLHVNRADRVGGAAIAAYRLHQALNTQGINSSVMVETAITDDEAVTTVPPLDWLSKRLYRFTHQAGLNEIHLASTFNILKSSAYQQATVLNFHNLHTGYFNYLAMPKLTQHKPAVFTLHDMWSFTGHCAYSFECDRWKNGCGQCPALASYPEVSRDSTSIEWQLKRWVYRHSNLHIVTLSKWLTAQVKQSILRELPLYEIPNGIDTECYQPLESKACRQALGLPTEQFILLCAAADFQDRRKGGDLIAKTLAQIPGSLKAKTTLVVLGDGGDQLSALTGIEVKQLGYISSEHTKAQVYSAADLFIFTSRADNLPLVLQESMACGTPMVSFDVGGISDLVRSGITGHLARPADTNDFCRGISTILSNDPLRQQMRVNCRRIALEEYDIRLQTSRYIELYRQVAASTTSR